MDPPDKSYPALFIAKILGDDQKITIDEPDSLIHIQELVYKFLTKKISTHQNIEEFFEEKFGYDVFISSESDPKFIVEKEF